MSNKEDMNELEMEIYLKKIGYNVKVGENESVNSELVVTFASKLGYNVQIDKDGTKKFTLDKSCEWCGEVFEESELIKTKIGNLCFTCKRAIESRGEEI